MEGNVQAPQVVDKVELQKVLVLKMERVKLYIKNGQRGVHNADFNFLIQHVDSKA